MKRKARVIAFYLPQFHPIPENDEWWGKGFTEWTNVGKAKPIFRGHYQPRVPADLGYYDLRLPIIREQQAQMARDAGVEGFCYWHYWFGNGKTLLAEIFDEVLTTGKPDFPFCLGWANHSWTRKNWNAVAAKDALNQNLLLQEYPGDEDYKNHFFNVLPAFKDKRYIRVDNKPLFVVYQPLNLPDSKHFMSLWNRLAKENGLDGIHFVGIISGFYPREFEKFLDLGFDGLTFENFRNVTQHMCGGFWPAKVVRRIRDRFSFIPPEIYDYKKAIKYWLTDYDKREYCYPSILPQWDPSPRRTHNVVILKKSTPELFKKHVEKALEYISHKSKEHQIIFLKSWNEWAEGNYVEPDIVFKHGYLDALKEVLVGES